MEEEMRHVLTVGLVVSFVGVAFSDMVISEWMYNGLGASNKGEFVEFTNIGPYPINLAGWSYDDDSPAPGTVNLSAFGVVEVGQSVILTDEAAATFATNWNLTGIVIIGGNGANLGRTDEINLFDAGNNLVDRLTYGDDTYPGTPRTQNKSCNIPAADYGYTVAQATWVLAAVGDEYGSWASTLGVVGSPGIAPIPEPATLVLLLGGLLAARRR
jgi:predicted extracellular nuclease